MQYRLYKRNKNVEEMIIEKLNITHQFTFKELAAKLREWKKTLKELKDNLAISEAIVMNVEKNHPKVAALSVEDLKAAKILCERRQFINDSKEDITTVKGNFKRYEMEIRNAKKELGLKVQLDAEVAIKEYKEMTFESEEALDKFKKQLKK